MENHEGNKKDGVKQSTPEALNEQQTASDSIKIDAVIPGKRAHFTHSAV